MQVLWKLKQGFLKDILENSPEPRPHSNTVATILKILVEKGFVEYEVRAEIIFISQRSVKPNMEKKASIRW